MHSCIAIQGSDHVEVFGVLGSDVPEDKQLLFDGTMHLCSQPRTVEVSARPRTQKKIKNSQHWSHHHRKTC